MSIKEYQGKIPKIHRTAFVAESSKIIGGVTIGRDSSVWYNAVIRGDEEDIEIGERSNIQDMCVLHSDKNTPLMIGDGVSLGHGVIAHGCKIGSNTIIGMGATILNRAEIGEWSIIGAGSLITQGKKIATRTVAVGSPAKSQREVGEEDMNHIKHNALVYLSLKNNYLKTKKSTVI